MDEQKIRRFASELLHKHYSGNDVEAVIASFAPDITWIGAGEGQQAAGYAETAAFFRRFRGVLPKCRIWDETFTVSKLGGGLYLCMGVFWVAVDDPATGLLEAHQRVTYIFREAGGRLECVHIHNSNPYRDLEGDELFPEKAAHRNADYLQKRIAEMEDTLRQKNAAMVEAVQAQKQVYEELAQANRQMQVILQAIKGGLKISRDDENFSYAYVSEELCALFGYTRDEFMKATGGTAVGAVYPPDLPRVLGECDKAFANGGVEYAIKYRVRCKDGSLKWIIDSGKKVREPEGVTIINSIYLDVTEIEQANQKIAEQKEYLDSIYSSILCGIVQYQLDGGAFTSVKMNNEALKMLGYASESECFALGVEAFYSRIHERDRNRVRQELARLHEPGSSFHDEYQICRPDGGTIWVYGTTERICAADGDTAIQRIMIDITDKKELELALEEERQRFRVAVESTPVVVFEYDLENDRYTAYGTLEQGVEKHNVELAQTQYLAQHMEEQVRAPFQKGFRRLLEGDNGNQMELQMAPYYGSADTVWARVTITRVPDRKGALRRIIGKISNIQSEKEKEFALQEAHSRDSLTGLYNKETGVRMVREYLENKRPDEVCGLMLLDMDDFRSINQEEGHVFADAVLQEVADVLRAETGEDDIRIRLGGDEFMLFLKGCNKARATVLGPRIAAQVHGLLLTSQKAVSVSVSIGMCVTEVVEDYSGLYRCAESTLKYVKAHGKGRAACYLDTSNELGVMLTDLYTDRHPVNAIERQAASRSTDLVSFALELLDKSKNLDDAVTLLLSRVGKAYGLGRVTLLEVDPEFLTCRFSYQWAQNKADLRMGEVVYITQEEYRATAEQYDAEGLSSRAMAGHPSRFAAALHASIWNHGAFVGSLGFEREQAGYEWSEEERKLLKELVRIIPSFIMKARADAVSKAKTDFLSRMSHELRTPMNAISGMTVIAENALDDKQKAMECLHKIERANAYLLELINDILDMSRIESGKMELNLENADLAQMLQSLMDMLRPQAEAKGVALRVENGYKENRRVVADMLRLNQVLVNIIGNAIKFTPSGGRIDVRLEQVRMRPQDITLRFSVQDTGIGIGEEAKERIFNAFEQEKCSTAAEYGGTGLGLSISSRIVQMMGGKLAVDSETGKGSVFYFTLTFPYAPDQAAVEPQPAKEGLCDLHGRRVLLVEDNDLNREIAEEILGMNGMVVETAVDGLQAVHKFEESEPGYYDAILMDIRMPVMDGLEATRRIRTLGKADSRNVPVIAMTANAFDEDTRRSMDSGMDGHLSKPIEVSRLLEMLGDCMLRRDQAAARGSHQNTERELWK
ncbi:PAS domain-containing protein [Intestinibacillus massiliensis]|uniref:PAS domain-containing protein n=1 Tax=Intestinibacillus massiliensis TaxID=1871029 RepID=UPI000B362EAF|nr:PAS domain-containing protein [Intestinibacillus massiliensis]